MRLPNDSTVQISEIAKDKAELMYNSFQGVDPSIGAQIFPIEKPISCDKYN